MLKKLTAKVLNGAAELGRDRKGNIAIMGALVMPMLLIASGVAVNVAHLYNTRSNMLQNLDIALTSTTRDIIAKGMSKQDAMDSMASYIAANGNAGMSEADLLKLITLDIDPNARTVKAQLKSDVKMPFAVFGLAETYPVVVDAASAYSDKTVEVGLMLDITGSMGERGTPLANGRYQTKLDNLKTAAADAVENLLGYNIPNQIPRVRVALVPYAQSVNVGPLSDATWIEGGILGGKPLGLSELNLPINNLLKAALNLLRGQRDRGLVDNCATDRKRLSNPSNPASALVFDSSEASPDLAMVNRDSRLDSCPAATIVPLTTNLQRLKQEISDFRAGGHTAGHIGIQWTRYMLSPQWGSFLNSRVSNSAPVAYNNKKVKKIAVLMTDGEFNTAYAGVTSGNPKGGQAVKSQAYAQQLCTDMKANGIEVFTIGFMLDSADAAATMAACASDTPSNVRHFFNASNAEELKQAFDAITANVEQVRLTN